MMEEGKGWYVEGFGKEVEGFRGIGKEVEVFREIWKRR